MCRLCDLRVHTTCLGLGRHAIPGGTFTCADCELLAVKLETAASSALQASAHQLVWLKARRAQDSSQATYASGLHRFIRCHITDFPLARILPCEDGVGLEPRLVQLFVAWASTRYKISTIKVTMSALIDWCKSKSVTSLAVTSKEVKDLLATVAREQGEAGVPVGKTGMSKGSLAHLLTWCAQAARMDTTFASLYFRDSCWLVLGFFGMLRRSELIALKMTDVTLPGIGATRHIMLRIRKSKTDKRSAGASVLIAGTTQEGWDLLGKVQRYQNIRLGMGAQPEDPFLVGWDLDTLTLGKSAIKSGQGLATRLKKLLSDVVLRVRGLDLNPATYGMHSLRRGGVVAAWGAGVDLEKIKAHGRWRSDAVRAYLTAGTDIKLSVTAAM